MYMSLSILEMSPKKSKDICNKTNIAHLDIQAKNK